MRFAMISNKSTSSIIVSSRRPAAVWAAPLALSACLFSCDRRPEPPPGEPPKSTATTPPAPPRDAEATLAPRRRADASTLKVTSKSFKNGAIPTQFTCEGGDKSPSLSFEGVPDDAKSLVLMVIDVDVPDPAHPTGTWVHWILYNIPPSTTELPEAMGTPPAGVLVGKNDFRRSSYGGPCPPVGRHRYFHKLYALDTVLPDLKNPNQEQLEYAMQDRVLEQAEVIGTYQKTKK
jgi:Raf kinase inhibitor-like YbhB/YbcL family protein